MANTNKNPNPNLSEYNSENEIKEFPKFTVIGSLKETLLIKLIPFLIEKIIFSRANPWLEAVIYLEK